MPSPLSEHLHSSLSIIYRLVTDLQIDPKNARVHPKKQIEQIAKSIETFGFSAPILVNSELKVIAGHGRLAACKLLGITNVPTISLKHLTKEQVRAFAIADNRLSETADWDERQLAEELKSLSELKLDFSLDVIGFDPAEIDIMIDGLQKPAKEKPVDAGPKIKDLVSVTKPRDLWFLGKHRLFCGDALLPETYSKLMGEHSADSVFTSPPIDALRESLYDVFVNLKTASTRGAVQIVCDWRRLQHLLSAAERAELELTDLRVWTSNGAKQDFLQGNFKLLLVFENVANKRKKMVQLKPCPRTPGNNHPPKKDGSTNTDASHFRFDDTSVAMAAEAITCCTARGQNILDPFLGNGATLLAAEQVGRICFGIDLDPQCVDMSIRRWQQLTGETAVHANSNRAFGDPEEVPHGEKR